MPFVWNVVLPERKAALGKEKPRARIVVHEDAPEGDASEHTIFVPLSVGRELKRRYQSDVPKDASHTPTKDSATENLVDLNHLIATVSRAEAFKQILRLSAHRDHSTYELNSRLERDGFSPECAEEVLGRASELGIVDDLRFAASFIRGKISSGWGMCRIERELNKRGIDSSKLDGWPDDFFEESELERAIRIASSRSQTRRSNKAGTIRFLVGRGFSASIAHKAASYVASK